MSTTVTYKGNTIATVDNNTKTLLTSGKYCEADIILTDVTQGGGGGLEYEEGTWTLSEDASTEIWISFSNAHTVAPFFYVIWDATETYDSTSSTNGGTEYCNFGQLGEPLHTSSSGRRYGYVRTFIRSGGHSSYNILYPYTDTGDGSVNYPRYWATETGIKAGRYYSGWIWQAGRTYKWIAVWAPTT